MASEKLIELCRTACTPSNCEKYGAKPCFECVAEHLMANDVVPVVRCRDCVHKKEHSGKRFCEVWALYNGMGDEGFCNYGERKDNG